MSRDAVRLLQLREERNRAAKVYDDLLDRRAKGDAVDSWKLKSAAKDSAEAYENYHFLASKVATVGPT